VAKPHMSGEMARSLIRAVSDAGVSRRNIG